MVKTKLVWAWGLLFLILILLIPLTGCNFFKSAESLAAPAEELDTRLVKANNSLGFNIFHKLQTTDDADNIFISPSSILTALAMTYNGAEGETRSAMEAALQLEGMSRNNVNEAFADLLTILQNPDPDVELAVANSLWSREGIEFNEDFIERSREYFKAEIESLDFDNPGAAEIINNWVKEQTRNTIEKIVEPPINPDTILFLINAIYFKGEWSEQFDPEQTREILFTLPDGSRIEHPVMMQKNDYRYLESDLFQAVSLPYGQNERISMYVFLPAEDVGLDGLYKELDAETWTEWTGSFTSREGEVGLPRFKFEYETSLNETLKALGMENAFDENIADFSGMHPIPPRLYISEVKHKSFIDVNEEGTEAAAVTSVEVEVTSAPETEPFRIIVDRPFFFAIADSMTGSILFMGSVTDPR